MSIHFEKHTTYPDLILIKKFCGEVNVDTIIDSWIDMINQNLIMKTHKGVINDLVNCKLIMNHPGFEKLIAFLKSQKLLRSLKLAVICDSPDKIVYPMLGESVEKELKIKPFTTIDAAINWIIN